MSMCTMSAMMNYETKLEIPAVTRGRRITGIDELCENITFSLVPFQTMFEDVNCEGKSDIKR